jgi:hypothetical protein
VHHQRPSASSSYYAATRPLCYGDRVVVPWKGVVGLPMHVSRKRTPYLDERRDLWLGGSVLRRDRDLAWRYFSFALSGYIRKDSASPTRRFSTRPRLGTSRSEWALAMSRQRPTDRHGRRGRRISTTSSAKHARERVHACHSMWATIYGMMPEPMNTPMGSHGLNPGRSPV